jgi:hypothetical protein
MISKVYSYLLGKRDAPQASKETATEPVRDDITSVTVSRSTERSSLAASDLDLDQQSQASKLQKLDDARSKPARQPVSDVIMLKIADLYKESSNPRLRKLAELEQKPEQKPCDYEENLEFQMSFMQAKLEQVRSQNEKLKRDGNGKDVTVT